MQALSDSRFHIREQCATSGTAERWTPLDLSEDKAQLAGGKTVFETESFWFN